MPASAPLLCHSERSEESVPSRSNFPLTLAALFRAISRSAAPISSSIPKASSILPTARPGTYPRLQIITIKQLLEGNKLDLPAARIDVTFKKAQRAKAKQRALGEGETP